MTQVLALYTLIFIAIFDLHAQYPMLSPFALSLGATPTWIGWIMGIYSLTHIPGHWVAGQAIDRYGGKRFIVGSLCVAGLLLVAQSYAQSPWQLLLIRACSGVVLAFLTPACLAMIAKLAKNDTHQSALMSGHGFIHTVASVGSPVVGAWLVNRMGFAPAFLSLGIGLVVSALVAMRFIQEPSPACAKGDRAKRRAFSRHLRSSPDNAPSDIPLLFYTVPLVCACAQSIVYFEIPLLMAHASLMSQGVLFAIISAGALLALCVVVLHRIQPIVRIAGGTVAFALLLFSMSQPWGWSLPVTLFLIGITKGIIFPALAAALAMGAKTNTFGRAFSMLAIAYSIGSFIGPLLAGQLRHVISPFFLASLLLLGGCALLVAPIIPPKYAKRLSQ